MNKKGSALIMAVMIAMILSLMLGGLYTTTSSSISVVHNEIEKTRLYYAAEGGTNYMVSWLKNINYRRVDNYTDALERSAVFNSSSDSPRYFPSNAYPKNIHGDISLKNITAVKELDPGSDKAVWIFKAIAENKNKTKACTITIDNIMAKSVAAYASHFTKSGNGYYIDGYRWWGDAYFGEEIRFFGNPGPVFRNNVETSSVKSSRNIYNQNITRNYQNLFEFSKGLHDASSLTNETINKTEERLKKIFQQKYEHSVPLQDPQYTFLDWNRINDPGVAQAMGLKTILVDTIQIKPGKLIKNYQTQNKYTDLHIGYYLRGNDTYISISGRPYNGNWTQLMGPHVGQEYRLGNANIVAVDEGWRAVGVEGIVNQDVTLITHSSNIELHNDFVDKRISHNFVVGPYHGVENIPNWWWDSAYPQNNDGYEIYADQYIDLIQLWFQDKFKAPRIGLIAGAESSESKPNDFIIKKNQKTGAINGPNNDGSALFISASLISPYGKITAENYSSWADRINCIIFGSMKADHEGYTESGGKGIKLKYANEFRLSKSGLYPPGFRPLSGLNTYTNTPQLEFAATSVWKLGWK